MPPLSAISPGLLVEIPGVAQAPAGLLTYTGQTANRPEHHLPRQPRLLLPSPVAVSPPPQMGQTLAQTCRPELRCEPWLGLAGRAAGRLPQSRPQLDLRLGRRLISRHGRGSTTGAGAEPAGPRRTIKISKSEGGSRRYELSNVGSIWKAAQ